MKGSTLVVVDDRVMFGGSLFQICFKIVFLPASSISTISKVWSWSTRNWIPQMSICSKSSCLPESVGVFKVLQTIQVLHLPSRSSQSTAMRGIKDVPGMDQPVVAVEVSVRAQDQIIVQRPEDMQLLPVVRANPATNQ